MQDGGQPPAQQEMIGQDQNYLDQQKSLAEVKKRRKE